MAVAACALALNVANARGAEWEVKAVSDGKASCLIVSDKKPISDGYQEITAQILVDDKTVAIQSDSVLDGSFSDLGVRIGNKDFIKADRIAKERQAVFEAQYAELVRLYKAGLVTTVHLRFWPTWPSKGVQTAAFSLIGFTRAYEEAKCASH
ncbi:MAG TPA: hypothetical protein VGC70_15180 [Burkholderiales bacterium]